MFALILLFAPVLEPTCLPAEAARVRQDYGPKRRELAWQLAQANCRAEARRIWVDELRVEENPSRRLALQADRGAAVLAWCRSGPCSEDTWELGNLSLLDVEQLDPDEGTRRQAAADRAALKALRGVEPVSSEPFPPAWLLYTGAGVGLVGGVIATAAWFDLDAAPDDDSHKDKQWVNMLGMAAGYSAAIGFTAWALLRDEAPPRASLVVLPGGLGVGGQF